MTNIECLIDTFKKDLLDAGLSDIYLVNKYLLFGTPYLFRDREDLYFKLQTQVSEYFKSIYQIEISPSNIYMIGSAKLGFSISPSKLWNEINDDSDIDIVVISENLFNCFWDDLFDFNINIRSRTQKEDDLYWKFLEYFFKGWLRPDYFSFNYKNKDDWFDFFQKISYKEYDQRKVTCAIFKNETFFRKYHINNIKRIRGRLENE